MMFMGDQLYAYYDVPEELYSKREYNKEDKEHWDSLSAKKSQRHKLRPAASEDEMDSDDDVDWRMILCIEWPSFYTYLC